MYYIDTYRLLTDSYFGDVDNFQFLVRLFNIVRTSKMQSPLTSAMCIPVIITVVYTIYLESKALPDLTNVCCVKYQDRRVHRKADEYF